MENDIRIRYGAHEIAQRCGNGEHARIIGRNGDPLVFVGEASVAAR